MKCAMQVLAVALVAGPAGAVWADGSSESAAVSQVIQVETQEDAAVADDPAFCAGAGFPVNVHLNARVYGYELDSSSGVQRQQLRAIGTANACVLITTATFPPNLQQSMYLRLRLPQGEFVATGTCTISSNNVPETGIVLAGCALHIVIAPPDYLGGQVSSSSVFNPAAIAGYSTGSLWTLQLYLPPEPPSHGGGDCHDHGHGDGHGGGHDDHGHGH